MSKFSRILLVYDGTPEAKSALNSCAQLASALSLPVDVVSVVDTVGLNAASGGLLSGAAFAQFEHLAREALHESVTRLQRDGVGVHGYLTVGYIVDELSRYAEALLGIVMIGHRSRKRFASRWGERPVFADLADRLRGLTIVTIT
jgi:hypothetical protein